MHRQIRLLGSIEQAGSASGKTYRNGTMISAALGTLVCVAVLLFLLFAGMTVAKRDLPAGNMIMIAIGFTLVAIVAGYLVRLFWAQFRAATHDNNWVARLTDDGIWLNLRSWLNWRIDEATHMVAYVPYTAIAEVFEVREQLDLVFKVTPSVSYHAFVALKLKPDIDLSRLDQAIVGELRRVVQHPGFTSGTDAWFDVPLFVCGGNEIWIARRDMFLLRALAKRIPRAKQIWRHTNVGEMMTPDDVESALSPLRYAMFHSRWNTARQIAQFKLGLSFDESFHLLHQRALVSTRRTVD